MGIQCIPGKKWDIDRMLCLDLHSGGAMAEFCLGNFVAMEEKCDTIIARQDCTLFEKRFAYIALIQSLTARSHFVEAQRLIFVVLEQLGCRFPRVGSIIHIAVGLLKARWYVDRAVERFESLPYARDENFAFVSTLFNLLVPVT